MLTIIIPKTELYNDSTKEFLYVEETVLQLEHSLVSLSKWESKFEKPFLTAGEKTDKEVLGYIEAMVVSGEFSEAVYRGMSAENFSQINDYISSTQSATTFQDFQVSTPGRQEIITSELIYYWMVSYNVPFECQHWHLNRLFTLLRICNIKNSKPKKMSRAEMARRNREINERRRAELGTSG